jgi:hypothetical protein
VLVVPFRVFGSVVRSPMLPPAVVLLGLAARPEFLTRYGAALMG